MGIEIALKRTDGEVILKHCCEDNTIKKTLLKAIRLKLDLRYIDLKYTDLRSIDLRSTDLRYSDLRYTDLTGSDLKYTDLRNTTLTGSDLKYTDLRNSDLRDADLKYTALTGADLRNANLRNTDLRDADLNGVKFGKNKILIMTKELAEERRKILNQLDKECQKECINSVGKPMFKVGVLVSMLAEERIAHNLEIKSMLQFLEDTENINSQELLQEWEMYKCQKFV